MGIVARYNSQDISIYLSHVLQNIEQRIIALFNKEGRKFVDDAKAMTAKEGSFNNRTFNLRSSIGYYIFANGKLVDQYFSGNAEGKRAADEAVLNIPMLSRGYQLIGIAGMDYAVAVESRGYNVITVQATMTIVSLRSQLKAA